MLFFLRYALFVVGNAANKKPRYGKMSVSLRACVSVCLCSIAFVTFIGMEISP